MNKQQYNNVIENTLKHEQSAQTDDSLATARAIFNNMGVALPQGDIKTVYETIKTDNYMGWKSCFACLACDGCCNDRWRMTVSSIVLHNQNRSCSPLLTAHHGRKIGIEDISPFH